MAACHAHVSRQIPRMNQEAANAPSSSLDLELDGGSEEASTASLCSLSLSSSDNSLSLSSSDNSLSEKEVLRFNPEQYLAMHKKAIAERTLYGHSGPRMKLLYRYWCEFLQYNFNDAMYYSFLCLAQEDAAQGQVYGLRYLFSFFKKRLASCFDSEHFYEFEQLAHRYHDYLDYEYGIRCLLELLTMGTAAVVSASGCTLNALTVSLLEAWGQFVHGRFKEDRTSDTSSEVYPSEAMEHPRAKLHKQLAEKRKKRSKARPVPAAVGGSGDDLSAAGEGLGAGAVSASILGMGVGEAGEGAEGQLEGGAGDGGAERRPHVGGCGRGGGGGRQRAGGGAGDKAVNKAGASRHMHQQQHQLLQQQQQQRMGSTSVQKKMLRAKAQPWMPQAQPKSSSNPEARRLPDRLGDWLGN